MSVPVLTVVKDALYELGALDLAVAPDGDITAFVIGRANRLIDSWNAVREAVYAVTMTTYTITPNLQPHTIGPSGATWTATVRPVDPEGFNVILNNVTPTVRRPLNIRDYQWWMSLPVQGVSTPFPTDVYYDPAWPLGKCYFWPVPTTAYQIEIITRIVLSEVTATDTYTMPPGYQEAFTLTLSEDLAASLGRAVPDDVTKRAAKARGRVFANNGVPHRLVTADSGIPQSGSGTRAVFNYRTGTNIPSSR